MDNDCDKCLENIVVIKVKDFEEQHNVFKNIKQIIKEGRINLKKDFPVAGEKASEVIGPGDFFGVISAMSQLTQIESALSLTPVVLIGVSYTKFGELIQKNSPLAMKIIRYFSKKKLYFTNYHMLDLIFICRQTISV
jgi:CRP-like cAMP-binding protein